jgi:hypothetical protein
MEPTKVYDYDPHNLPPDVLQAIGLIAACSAQTNTSSSRASADALASILNIQRPLQLT